MKSQMLKYLIREVVIRTAFGELCIKGEELEKILDSVDTDVLLPFLKRGVP